MEQEKQKRLRKFWPRIAKEIDLSILLPGLSCLLEPDRQTLERKLDNMGNWKAIAIHLPECLYRRPNGYKELLEGMLSQDKADLVREIDPTFPIPGHRAPDVPSQNIQPHAEAAAQASGVPLTYEESQVTAMMQQPPYVSNMLQQQQLQHPPGANRNFSPAGQPMLNTVPMQVQSSTNHVAAPTNPANTVASNVHTVANNVPGSALLQHRHYTNPTAAPSPAIYPPNTGTNMHYAEGDMNMQQPNISPILNSETSTQTSLSQNTSQGVGTGNDARIIHINVTSDGGAQNIQFGQGNEFSAGNQSPGSLSNNMSDDNETVIEIVRGNADETGASAEGNSQSQKEQDLIDFNEPERDVLNAPSIMGNNREGMRSTDGNNTTPQETSNSASATQDGIVTPGYRNYTSNAADDGKSTGTDGNNTTPQDTSNSASSMMENSATPNAGQDGKLTYVNPGRVNDTPEESRVTIVMQALPPRIDIPPPIDDLHLTCHSSNYTTDRYSYTTAERMEAESSSLGCITSGTPEDDGNAERQDDETLVKRMIPAQTNPPWIPTTVNAMSIEITGSIDDSIPQGKPGPDNAAKTQQNQTAQMASQVEQRADKAVTECQLCDTSSFEVSNLSRSNCEPSNDQQGQSGTNIVTTTEDDSDMSQGDPSEPLQFSFEYKFVPPDLEMDCEGGAPEIEPEVRQRLGKDDSGEKSQNIGLTSEMELSDISPMQASGNNIQTYPVYVSGVTNSRSKSKGEDGKGHVTGEDIPQEVVQIGEGACEVRQRRVKDNPSGKSRNIGLSSKESNGDSDEIVAENNRNQNLILMFSLLMITIVAICMCIILFYKWKN